MNKCGLSLFNCRVGNEGEQRHGCKGDKSFFRVVEELQISRNKEKTDGHLGRGALQPAFL